MDVVERSPGPSSEGAGLFLPGNAVRALAGLGLDQQVAERAERIERQRFSDHRGRVLFEVRTDELWSGVGDCLALPRSEMHAVLLAGAGDVSIRWGAQPVAVTVEGSRVLVEVDDGSAADYDLVLGADGLRSSVRRLVLGDSGPRAVGQYARRFVLPSAADTGEPNGVWSVRLGRRTSFLTIPIGQGRLYCYVDGPLESAGTPLAELLAGYAEPVPSLLGRLDEATYPVQSGPIEEVVLESSSRGGVLLVGDAAHATSPNMAEGAGMAFEDAVVLAESLVAEPDVPAAIARFEGRRRPRTTWVREQTHRRDKARGLSPVVRNQVLGRFGRRILVGNYLPLREPA